MIDISELVSDPDFAQQFQVIRYTGGFASEGEYTQTPAAPITMTGVIQPAKEIDTVQFLREGERLGNMIVIYCATQIFESSGTGQNSDVIVWHGTQYRVHKAKHWQDHGYWQAWAEGQANV
jgi:hypothetical protein